MAFTSSSEQGIRVPLDDRAALDAAIAFSLHYGHHWRGASEAGRLGVVRTS